MNKNIFRRKGFTLAELMVTLVVFALFSSTLLGILTLALRYLARTDRLINAQKNASASVEYISNELKTAVIDGTSTGYRSLSPVPANPTAVLIPSTLNGTANEIKFTAVNMDNRDPASSTYKASCDPSSSSFDCTDLANYQIVRYYVASGGREVHREVKKFDSSGMVTSTSDDVIAQIDEGMISISATLGQSNLVTLQVTCRAGTGTGSEVFTSKCDIFISATLI